MSALYNHHHHHHHHHPHPHPYHHLFIITLIFFLCSTLFTHSSAEWAPVYKTPEQIHLSFGSNIYEYVVTWLTFNQTAGPATVWYGVDRLEQSVSGYSSSFKDLGPLKSVRYVHRVRLTGLKPNRKYYYRVGSTESWSPVLQFKTLPEREMWMPTLLIFGDLGNGNDRTVAMLQDEIQSERSDFAIHLGDFAYNLEHSDGKVGDAFFRDIEGLASYRPYQVMPGNHEDLDNYTAYNSRFSMFSEGSDTGKDLATAMNNFWWSYNFGRAHLVFFTNEFYYTQQYGTGVIHAQLQWLEEDLKRANENRRSVPWIITLGHRPLYDNWYVNNRIRVGTPELPGFEQLFWKYGVDVQFYAHDHIFERMWPVYNRRVYNGTEKADDPYYNPKAPVHITSGSAGCVLEPEALNPIVAEYSAFRSTDYTYSRLTVESDRVLRFVTISQNQNRTLDEIRITKDNHGPYRGP